MMNLQIQNNNIQKSYEEINWEARKELMKKYATENRRSNRQNIHGKNTAYKIKVYLLH